MITTNGTLLDERLDDAPSDGSFGEFTAAFDAGILRPGGNSFEIIAKPKGKKLVTITQMSGGERALTAIALLFSLYLVKPSPFCILDEIDAPLDDANCHRFLRLIRRFSNRTQFIIITHNKITMEAADTLYGVTMESPGVSKLVSVRFGVPDENGNMTLARSETSPTVESLSEDEVEIPPAVVERMTPSLISPAGPGAAGSTDDSDDDSAG
ncbi:MAG: AAA family ATPase [candidate division Zixibacteria bacterium]|nr:AAA family ATPase [candidate division Zixibacteria bacterium]